MSETHGLTSVSNEASVKGVMGPFQKSSSSHGNMQQDGPGKCVAFITRCHSHRARQFRRDVLYRRVLDGTVLSRAPSKLRDDTGVKPTVCTCRCCDSVEERRLKTMRLKKNTIQNPEAFFLKHRFTKRWGRCFNIWIFIASRPFGED